MEVSGAGELQAEKGWACLRNIKKAPVAGEL